MYIWACLSNICATGVNSGNALYNFQGWLTVANVAPASVTYVNAVIDISNVNMSRCGQVDTAHTSAEHVCIGNVCAGLGMYN